MTINKHFYQLLMLYYDRADVSEGIDVSNTRKSKELL